ncbi:MAG TPA: thiamine-phosphate kinase [bacterium]|nr:thiamine-phosphate kinase [bacterium]
MPNLQSLGEFGLIERVRRRLPPSSGWEVGIGDDTAVFRLSSHHYQLFTEDLLVEGVHFRRGSLTDWRNLGWKSLTVNLSDLAAMGGRPLGAVIGLAIPKKTRTSEIDAFYRGLAEAARRFRCPIVGGDTNASPAGVTIAVAVLGESRHKPLLRSDARPGDTLWVSGELGAAALGWEAIQKRVGGAAMPFRRRHARPEPRLEWGEKLARSGMVSAALDLSDGLAGDLVHLACASGVGFEVDVDQVPRSRAFGRLCQKMKIEEERLLLAGGEDYELLFTVRRGAERRFQEYCRRHRLKVTRIGQAKKSQKLVWHRSGKKLSRVWEGYRHF